MSESEIMKALATIDAWSKSIKRVKWIGDIYWGFVDTYCADNSPVSVFDKPEIERLERKIGNWFGKAKDRYCDLTDEAFELKKKYRRNKKFMARFNDVQKQCSVYEGVIVL